MGIERIDKKNVPQVERYSLKLQGVLFDVAHLLNVYDDLKGLNRPLQVRQAYHDLLERDDRSGMDIAITVQGKSFRYRLDNIMNLGGFGIVLALASVPADSNSPALCMKVSKESLFPDKALYQDGSLPESTRRIIREHIALARLAKLSPSSPAPLLYSGRILKNSEDPESGCAITVMERIIGKSLAQYARTMNSDDAMRIMRNLVQAVAAIHEAGILHRDLKPDNILVSPNGDIKIIDFGLAVIPELIIEKTSHHRPGQYSQLSGIPYPALYALPDPHSTSGTLHYIPRYEQTQYHVVHQALSQASTPEAIATLVTRIGRKRDFYALGGLLRGLSQLITQNDVKIAYLEKAEKLIAENTQWDVTEQDLTMADLLDTNGSVFDK